MKRNLLFLLVTLFALGGSAQMNLLQNGSFDSAGLPYGNHWYDYCNAELTYLNNSNQYQCNSAPVNMVNDYPSANPPGDTISVHCQTVAPGGCGIKQFLTGLSGTNIYQLKFWMKSMPSLGGGGQSTGAAAIANYIAPNQYEDDTVVVNSGWQQYTIIDTLTTVVTDSIYVELKSTGPDMNQGHVYFDNAELTIIGTITSSNKSPFEMTAIKINPVPADEYVIIEVSNVDNLDCTIDLYNFAGQKINAVSGNSSSLTLERNGAEAGLYFFQVKINGKPAGTGKIVFAD